MAFLEGNSWTHHCIDFKMEFLATLISESVYFDQLTYVSGWLGWVALLVLVLGLNWYGQEFHVRWTSRRIILLAALFLFIPIATLLIGIRLPVGDAAPVPGRPIEPRGPAMMLFAAIPWMLAAGLLGPASAAGLGALGGALIGLLDTHSPFTPLEYALAATLLSLTLRQPFRTWTFRLLRFPIVTSLLIAGTYPFLYIFGNMFFVGDTLSDRVQFALSRVGWVSLAFGGQMLVAGLVALLVSIGFADAWGPKETEQPAPAQTSLETRFIYTTAPLISFLFMILIAGDWFVARGAARTLLGERIQGAAELSSQTVPFVLETGQNLITQLADDARLFSLAEADLIPILEEDLRTVPFFLQLFVLDEDGQPVAGFPVRDFSSIFPTSEERLGIDLAIQGVPYQNYSAPPAPGEDAAQLTFIKTLQDESGRVRGVLLARSGLESNPFSDPMINGLKALERNDGAGILLDDAGLILYHPDASQILMPYTGQVFEVPMLFDDTAPDGTSRLVFYQPVKGRNWAVVASIPASQANELAITIAANLLLLALGVGIVILIALRMGLRSVTGNLQALAEEAARIAENQLDEPLEIRGEDEVGQLGLAFDLMRVRLKERMEEYNRLLFVSQGVAANLEIEGAVQSVLEVALAMGADAARLVLHPMEFADFDGATPMQFTLGENAERYAGLDNALLELTRQRAQVPITNPARAGLLLEDGTAPASLLAMALQHKDKDFGTLWLAYEKPHQFDEGELRFLDAVARQAAQAAFNAQLYLGAQVGRERMEAILSSTPDPVLVVDRQHRLLLANPAARATLENGDRLEGGVLIDEVISHEELLALIKTPHAQKETAEISLGGKRTYFATSSPITMEGRGVGRVCLLQDVTQFKEIDALKSEFVATVSHDLRAPLTLMRGYASMLQMVGDLNEQQAGYLQKIVGGVDSMSKLVNNLLDLGRIEAGVGLKLEPFKPMDVLQHVSEALQLQVAQKQIELKLNDRGAPDSVEGDAALLQQAIMNLIDNAIKYTQPGGKVQVEISQRDAYLLVAVRDNGIGIAPIDQPRLFERFFRAARRDSRKQRGSGLGLAIVKSIAERHGGRVWLESELGKGSSFYMLIPLRQSSL